MSALAHRLRLTDEYGATPGGILLTTLLGVAALFAILALALVLGGRAYGRGVCSRWGEQTGYPTRFVVLGFMDRGTCLARLASGRWVQNTSITGFAPAGGKK